MTAAIVTASAPDAILTITPPTSNSIAPLHDFFLDASARSGSFVSWMHGYFTLRFSEFHASLQHRRIRFRSIHYAIFDAHIGNTNCGDICRLCASEES